MAGQARPPHFVQSLDRGLSVLRAFGAQTPELSLSEVAAIAGLTRAAARRFLLTLVDLGYASSDGRLFSLTPRVLELGYTYLSSITLPEVAEPHLERLASEVHESASVSVLDENVVVYVARIPTSRIMTVAINVGTRLPVHATSMGRVLLAGLPADQLEAFLEHAHLDRFTTRTVTDPDRLRSEVRRTRSLGYAVVDQELEDGLRSVAAPIHDARGAVIAAANVSTHASRTTLEGIRKRLLPPLQRAVAAIEADVRVAPRRSGRRA